MLLSDSFTVFLHSSLDTSISSEDGSVEAKIAPKGPS
jgi:hypothetical protein